MSLGVNSQDGRNNQSSRPYCQISDQFNKFLLIVFGRPNILNIKYFRLASQSRVQGTESVVNFFIHLCVCGLNA